MLCLGAVISGFTLVPAQAAFGHLGCNESAGVTHVGSTITGTGGNDSIDCRNSPSPVVIFGGGGNDSIGGSFFGDFIIGGAGNDFIDGFRGDDFIDGGANDDILIGSDGADIIIGGLGVDQLSGEDGIDILIGPPNDGSVDRVAGGAPFGDICAGPGTDPDLLFECP